MYAGLKARYHTARDFVVTHRQYIPLAALLLGFVWDSLTLNRPDQVFDNAVIIFYLVVSAGIIGVISYQNERARELSVWWFAALQFCFGNLASALFVIFGKSGTLVGSWPFLLIFLTLLIGNEFLRDRYARLQSHMTVFFLFLLSYAVLIVPVAVRAVGPEIFIASSIIGLVAMTLFLGALYLVAPQHVGRHRRALSIMLVAVFIGFNVFYFFNLIPPAPLALRDIGIYHDVERMPDGNYRVSYEKGSWWYWWKRSDGTLYTDDTDVAFCFSAVFAPARISTLIYHRWEYYDEALGEWKTSARVSFSLTGGRSDGFRGYSTSYRLTAGEWRCSVETERGALVGRRNFSVEVGSASHDIVSTER